MELPAGPLIDRRRELELLTALDEVRQFCLVFGPPGSGKTRLWLRPVTACQR